MCLSALAGSGAFLPTRDGEFQLNIMYIIGTSRKGGSGVDEPTACWTIRA